jgi:hypothetical protein
VVDVLESAAAIDVAAVAVVEDVLINLEDSGLVGFLN